MIKQGQSEAGFETFFFFKPRGKTVSCPQNAGRSPIRTVNGHFPCYTENNPSEVKENKEQQHPEVEREKT